MNETTKPAELADYPVVITLPIQWGDQDAFGHVNNTVFIRWYESARIAYLHESGMEALMDAEGVGPILASITCHYRRQQNFPDKVLVGARITRVGGSSFTMEHAVYSTAQSAITADGSSVVVSFDYSANKSRKISDDVRGAIAKTEIKPVEGLGE